MIQRQVLTVLALGVLLMAAPVAADHIPVLNEDAKLLASDGAADDWLGHSVAIDGDVIVVGSILDSDLGVASGSAYVFERNESGLWIETSKLIASDGESEDVFGADVSLDGRTVVVTATGDDGDSGAAYVFERDGAGAWVETAKLLASDGAESDAFGCHVAIDGDTIGISARGNDEAGFGAGAAYIFERNETGTWVEAVKLLASDGESGDFFGTPIEIDGNLLAVGSPGDKDHGTLAGAAYTFERNKAGTWVETDKVYAAHPGPIEGFNNVAVSGQTVVVGAEGGFLEPGLMPGTVDAFRRNPAGKWVNVARLLSSDGAWGDQFGVDVAIDGETVVVGARLQDQMGSDAGAAYVFTFGAFFLKIHLDPQELLPGDELRIGLHLQYNRTETVTTPLRLWLEDAAGAEVGSKTTPPITLRIGSALSQKLSARIPPGTPPGQYFVKVGVEREGEWEPVAAEPFQVVGAVETPPLR